MALLIFVFGFMVIGFCSFAGKLLDFQFFKRVHETKLFPYFAYKPAGQSAEANILAKNTATVDISNGMKNYAGGAGKNSFYRQNAQISFESLF